MRNRKILAKLHVQIFMLEILLTNSIDESVEEAEKEKKEIQMCSLMIIFFLTFCHEMMMR